MSDLRDVSGLWPRRSFLQSVGIGTAGWLSWRDWATLHAAEIQQRKKAVILLWMAGGPSQFETFDPKPGQETGGETISIATAIPGIQIAEGWDRTARQLGDIAIIRSLTNNEGNHTRASYQLHTGYLPSGGLKHPHWGSSLAERIEYRNQLPPVVSIGRTESSGYLGVDWEPFVLNEPGRRPDNTTPATGSQRFQGRRDLVTAMNSRFAEKGGGQMVAVQQGVFEQSVDLILSPELSAFDLADEPVALKKQYGETRFGRGCLLARRLVEAGVSFVEVRCDGWDTHFDHFSRSRNLTAQVDPAFGTLVADLKDRGLLDSTLVLWMGEFGRTPRVNARSGRDHFPRAFNAAIAGCGIRGGQVVGKTSSDGSAVADRPVRVPDLLKSVCTALEIDPGHEYDTPAGRPMKLVDGGETISELFA